MWIRVHCSHIEPTQRFFERDAIIAPTRRPIPLCSSDPGVRFLMTLKPPRAHVVALALSVAACARNDGDFIERDSAGVRLVVNNTVGAGWSGETPWRVTEELAIGSDTLGDEYRFGRIGDLAVAPNGNIAVIDQLAAVVRVFDTRGRHVRTMGRRGKGPGELSISSNGIYVLPGDSLLVLDPGERRMTVFAPDGTVGRVTALPPTPTGQGWLRLPDGRFLMRGLTIGRAEGRFTFWDALLSVQADGSATDTLFVFDHAKTDLGGPGRLRVQLIVNNPTWARLGDGRIAWTALDRSYVQVHDSTGRLVSRIRHAAWVTRPVTASDKAAMVELLRIKLTALGGDGSFADSPQVEAPTEFPAISTVRAGPRGTIWVQLMGPVESIDHMAINARDRADFLGGSVWHVLDSLGRFRGAVELPSRFRIFRVTDDALYGTARDDDGVERIVKLRLIAKR